MKCATLYLLALIVFCIEGPAQTGPSRLHTLRGAVTDSKAGTPLPARIVIKNDTGHIYNSFYEKLPGFFTQEDGTFHLQLPAGKYKMSIYRGIDYLSLDTSVELSGADATTLSFALRKWFPLKASGWVNGDGHNHLYTDVNMDSLMLDTVRRVCLAQGIDFVCAAQGWAGYNDSNWRREYARFSDDRFMLYYGSEMPKYRTGHTWWLGQTSTKGIYWQTMDTTYENYYYQSPQGTSWTFDSLKFPQIPDIEVVRNFKRADSSVAVIAHPTSWWWQKRGEVEKYVTNIAASLPLGLLAGKVWDAQVIMGYNPDHYFYQNLWFSVLNSGYRMTPVSELDGGYKRGDRFYYGSMRTYYKIDGALTIDKINDAVRKGRTFVTSGPIVMANIDRRHHYGDVIPANGSARRLYFDAYASGDKDDYISYVVLFRNGRIHKLWDTRKERPRKLTRILTIKERDDCWYALKVYGRRAWHDTAHLDVMKYCTKTMQMPADSVGVNSSVAITSPFYFRKEKQVEPTPLTAQISLSINAAPEQRALQNLKVEVVQNGRVVEQVRVVKDKASFQMPVNGIVKISATGHNPIYRTLYLDYIPYRNIIERIASGKWLESDGNKRFNPGEIPWSAFSFDETKRVLSKVSWNIVYARNERDELWEPFWKLFEAK